MTDHNSDTGTDENATLKRQLAETQTALEEAREREKEVAEYHTIAWLMIDDVESIRVVPMYQEEPFEVGPLMVQQGIDDIGDLMIVNEFRGGFFGVGLLYISDDEGSVTAVMAESEPEEGESGEAKRVYYRIAAFRTREEAEAFTERWKEDSGFNTNDTEEDDGVPSS